MVNLELAFAQPMMLKLQNYQFTVRYKKGKELFLADTLFQVVVSDHIQSPPTVTQECEVFHLEPAQMDFTPSCVTVDVMNQNKRRGIERACPSSLI